MNMLALRSGDDIIVIDAGLMFPEQELLGVDIVIPDITYLKQNKRMVRAIVLTHAHEDHIGAIPYILRDLNVPIYGTQFTLALVRKRLEEHGLLDDAKLRRSRAGTDHPHRALPDRVSPRHAQHHRLRGAGDSHSGGRDHSHRRFQNRSNTRRRQAVRLARVRAIRPGRRARAVQRQHQRRAARVHAVGESRGGAPGGTVSRRAGESGGLVLLELDSPHSAGDRHRADRRTENRIRRPQHGRRTSRSRTSLASCGFPTAASFVRRTFGRSIQSGWSCWRAERRPSRCRRYRGSRWTITGCSASPKTTPSYCPRESFPETRKRSSG